MAGKQRQLTVAVGLVILCFVLALPLRAAQLRLSWTPPVTNEDGTLITDLAGYQLYYGQRSGSYDVSLDVGPRTTYTLSGLQGGQTYYISVTAYDASRNESQYSNEVSITVRASCLGTGSGVVLGRVTTEEAGQAEIWLTLHGPGDCTDTTEASPLGIYRFHQVAPGSYTIIPTAQSCSFTPASQDVELTSSIAWVPFRATCP